MHFLKRGKWGLFPFTLFAVLALVLPSRAETITKTGTFGDTTMTYKVVLPPGYDPSREYPAILVFADSEPDIRIANDRFQKTWAAEAEKRGFIVIGSPPGTGEFLHQGGPVFPEFLDRIFEEYSVKDGMLHIAGNSNGGIRAFDVAAAFPDYFLSVTGFPGYLLNPKTARIQALRAMCIYMHVGELDHNWLVRMQEQEEMFKRLGLPVRLTTEKGQQHILTNLEGEGARLLFDEIQNSSGKCG